MKIAFLFSGQGSQYSGMLKDLYDSEPSVKAVFDTVDNSLKRDISGLCFHGTIEELCLTHNTQPCVLAADIAVGMLLKQYGIKADAVAGFSLGEYAALAYANAISLHDAFNLIQLRADAMQAAVPIGQGSMAAVIGAGPLVVDKICKSITKGYVIPANYNTPVQTVISGTTEGVNEAILKMQEIGLRTMLLPVSAPFHCGLMEPAARVIEKEFTRINIHSLDIPIYMNVDGLPHQNSNEIPDLLVRQTTNPVRWTDILENMHKDGVDTFIECGPGKTLSGFVKKTIKNVSIYRVDNKKTLDSVLSEFGKI